MKMKRRDFFRKTFAQLAGAAALGTAVGCARSGASLAESSAVRRASKANGATLNGIDVLLKQNFAPLKNLRLGLITNHTGLDRQRRPTIDLLKNAGVDMTTDEPLDLTIKRMNEVMDEMEKLLAK